MAVANPQKRWEPPKEGELNFCCAARIGRGFGGYSAIARDCFGDVVAVTYGRMKCSHPLEVQLRSILTTLQLAKRLKDEGKYDGPVAVGTHHAYALALVLGGDVDGLEVDSCEIDDDADDEYDGDWCVTLTDEEEIAKDLPQKFKDMIERDKSRAGLTTTKVATQAPAAEDSTQGAKVGGSTDSKATTQVPAEDKVQGAEVGGLIASKVATQAPTAEENMQGAEVGGSTASKVVS